MFPVNNPTPIKMSIQKVDSNKIIRDDSYQQNKT